jgi:hypothetical protein
MIAPDTPPLKPALQQPTCVSTGTVCCSESVDSLQAEVVALEKEQESCGRIVERRRAEPGAAPDR